VLVFLTSLLAASATEPTGPESLEIPYQSGSALDDVLRAEDDAMMADYLDRARTVVVGRVIAVRPDPTVLGQQEIATLLIEERLRGRAVGLVEFSVPLQRQAGRIQPAIIEGYRLLIFLDEADALVDGEGVFFLEGGFAWRNRTDKVFLRPSLDRVWSDSIDPTEDYITFPMAVLRARITDTGRRRWWASTR
jgi:hypothetical protein